MVEATSPTPEMDLNKIRKKVQHLLNLTTERGATEAEAATALSMAEAILEKYNLAMDSMNSGTEPERKLVEEEFMDGTNTWQRILVRCVAEHNMCETLRKGQKILIFGRALNVMAARTMFAWITPQIYSFYNRAVGDNNNLRANTRWRTDFYLGVATRIEDRIDELQRARHAADNDCKAIVLIRSAEATLFRNQLYPDLIIKRGRKRKVTTGYRYGLLAGSMISLGDDKRIGQDFRQIEE